MSASSFRPPGARAIAALLAAACALPALAYLPPGPAILKRVAQRRADLGGGALEVRGTVVFSGEAARRAAAATGLQLAGADLTCPAVITVKAPGRCRLELLPPGAAASERPSLSVKAGRLLGHRGLETVPAAEAAVTGLCALLGERGLEALSTGLAARGVSLSEVALGRLEGRVAWVLGGRPTEAKPQAWFDKAALQPIRLVAPVAGALLDVRLLDFGSPVGADIFPRALEVWSGKERLVRFTTEALTTNARAPDALF